MIKIDAPEELFYDAPDSANSHDAVRERAKSANVAVCRWAGTSCYTACLFDADDMPLSLPVPPGSAHEPVWRGGRFVVGGTAVRVLSYATGDSGWTDELTELHEAADGENHYINIASREHAVSVLQRRVTVSRPVIMDIGCSSGYTVKLLRGRMPHAIILGADYVRGPLEKLGASIPDLPLIQFDLTQCPLPGNSIDAAVLLNVFEHIKDDVTAMRQVFRILRPSGIAAIEVPAGPCLYDIYDQQLMHCRRYSMQELTSRLKAAGFEILERSHLGFFLYPGFWLVKKRNQRLMNAPAETQRAKVKASMRQAAHNPLMYGLMRLEERLRKSMYYPFGIRCLVTCRKP